MVPFFFADIAGKLWNYDREDSQRTFGRGFGLRNDCFFPGMVLEGAEASALEGTLSGVR